MGSQCPRAQPRLVQAPPPVGGEGAGGAIAPRAVNSVPLRFDCVLTCQCQHDVRVLRFTRSHGGRVQTMGHVPLGVFGKSAVVRLLFVRDFLMREHVSELRSSYSAQAVALPQPLSLGSLPSPLPQALRPRAPVPSRQDDVGSRSAIAQRWPGGGTRLLQALPARTPRVGAGMSCRQLSAKNGTLCGCEATDRRYHVVTVRTASATTRTWSRWTSRV